jgi:TusE/DsrC/DsvC family sulfur relay protein
MFNLNKASKVMPQLDENGYLLDAQKWTKEVAEILAREEVPNGLSEDHWRVIDFLRNYFVEYECVPPVRLLARKTGLSLRDLKKLFPNGLAKYACKYAGIPYRVLKLYP